MCYCVWRIGRNSVMLSKPYYETIQMTRFEVSVDNTEHMRFWCGFGMNLKINFVTPEGFSAQETFCIGFLQTHSATGFHITAMRKSFTWKYK